MIGASQARQIAEDVAEQALRGVVSAVDREVARKRANACKERLFHGIMATEGRRIWRPWHRWLARRLDARCRAESAGGCPVSLALFAEAKQRGLT